MAKVLVDEPKPCAQLEVSRAGPAQVLAPGDHGRGDLLSAKGGALALTGRQKIRHTLSNLRAVREQSTQHAGTEC